MNCVHIYIYIKELYLAATNSEKPKLFFTSYTNTSWKLCNEYEHIIIMNECVSFVLQNCMPFYETSIFYRILNTMIKILYSTVITSGFYILRHWKVVGGVRAKKVSTFNPRRHTTDCYTWILGLSWFAHSVSTRNLHKHYIVDTYLIPYVVRTFSFPFHKLRIIYENSFS